MRRSLAATALALPLFMAGVAELPAQTPGPGYAASISGAGSGSTTAAFNVIAFNSGWPTDYSLRTRSVQCGRTDTGTGSLKITFNDTASSVLIIPGSAGGGQVGFVFDQPLQVAADTNLTATMSANTTSVFCNAQGFLAN